MIISFDIWDTIIKRKCHPEEVKLYTAKYLLLKYEEYLKDEYNCLFYKQGNIEQAVSQIERIVEDKELRERLIKNGLETAKEREWSAIEKDVVDLYV